MIELRAGAATDVGQVRTINEDQLLVDSPLFAVADGMGGAAAGEVASALAVEALDQVFKAADKPTSDLLVKATMAANRAVFEQAEANPEMRGMGTTLVALALVEGPKLAIVNVGDSRLYSFRHGELRQVTDDHNLVAEMVAEGRISKEEAEVHPRRNIMTRALGVEPEVPVDLFEVNDLAPGDRYLLCSDGLPRELSDDYIEALLRQLSDPEEAARELVGEAYRRGGNDNITVVVVDVVDPTSNDATVVAPVLPPPQRPEEDAAGPPARPAEPRERHRLITPRVVLFFAVLLLILGGAAAAVGWYARSGYFVGLKGSEVVVYQGRPGGVLWFSPTVTYDSAVTTAGVLPRHLGDLHSGMEEPTLAAAKNYIESLVIEKVRADQAIAPRKPTPTTTVPKRTTTTTRR